MATSSGLRTAPPSHEANNQDVFVWALYLLGGADRNVDVEVVYLKSFELAPARLGWRTRPDIPDYKKTSKALQAVEASTHVGLVQKSGSYERRLTPDGVKWVERFKAILEGNYQGDAPVAAAATNEHERRRRSLRSSASYRAWVSKVDFDLLDLAEAFDCNAASPSTVWKARINEAHRAAAVLQDEELEQFATDVDAFLKETIGGYK